MTVRREALVLVGLVLVVDALFMGMYFVTGVESATDNLKLGFTVAWTVINLVVVIGGLTRIRRARRSRFSDRRPY